MKTTIGCFIALFLLAFGSPARALEPLALYDDFSSTFLDDVKWSGSESESVGVDILENVLQISKGSLHLLNRVYGNTGSDAGESTGNTRLEFADGDKITAIKATVQVNNVEATGCSANPTTNTRARTRLGGRSEERL